MPTIENLRKRHQTKLLTHAYRHVFRRDPEEQDIATWLGRLPEKIEVPELLRALRGQSDITTKPSPTDSKMSESTAGFFRDCLFDITDLVNFLFSGHRTVTGIQRLVTATLSELNPSERKACALMSILGGPGIVEPKIISWKIIDVIIDNLRNKTKIDFAKDIEQFIADGLPIKTLEAKKILMKKRTLFILGAGWIIPQFPVQHKLLAKAYNLTIATMLYDLIPFSRPDYVNKEAAWEFFIYLINLINVSHRIFTISNYVAQDLISNKLYLETFCPIFPTITPVQLARESPITGITDPNDLNLPESLTSAVFDIGFVLNVGSIEIRKNHLGIFIAWRKLLSALGARCPYLVVVGKLGWKAEDFLESVRATNHLDGRIIILNNVDDATLSYLYRKCQFTVYPSLEEGWGLPIGESLASGKLCITSDTSSMPEVGGGLCEYVDPHKPSELANKILELLSCPAELAVKQKMISDASLKSWFEYKTELATELEALRYLDNVENSHFNNAKISMDTPLLFYYHRAPEIYDRISGLGGTKISIQRIADARNISCSDVGDFEEDGAWIKANYRAEYFMEIPYARLTAGMTALDCRVQFMLPPVATNLEATKMAVTIECAPVASLYPSMSDLNVLGKQTAQIRNLAPDLFAFSVTLPSLKDIPQPIQTDSGLGLHVYLPMRLVFSFPASYVRLVDESFPHLGLLKLKEMIFMARN